MVLVWVAVAVVEVATTALFAAFLVGAAMVAAAVAYADQGAIPQVHRRLRRRPSLETVSGARAMIGAIAQVVDLVDGSWPRGHVRVWSTK